VHRRAQLPLHARQQRRAALAARQRHLERYARRVAARVTVGGKQAPPRAEPPCLPDLYVAAFAQRRHQGAFHARRGPGGKHLGAQRAAHWVPQRLNPLDADLGAGELRR